MKTLLTLALCLTVVAFVFAANNHTNNITQTGDKNDADVEQVHTGGGTVYPGNTATVAQVGNQNDVDIYQANNGFGGSGEVASVYQNGHRNDVSVDQFNDGHTALVDEDGNDNDANITQNGNKTDAYVRQLGLTNDADIVMDGNNATYAKIWQLGDHNKADQRLGEGRRVEDSWFTAKQQGDYNTAYQYMESDDFAGAVGQCKQYRKNRTIWPQKLGQTGHGPKCSRH